MSWVDDVNSKYGVFIEKCYTSHKPLAIGDVEIYGGSCINPPDGMDVYVGFDYGMQLHEGAYPWNKKCESVFYPIIDMQAPKNPKEFKEMVSWIADQLYQGKKVHLGCIGGHGRTGLVLAALVTHMTGNKDSIKYVRDNYCHKAVESVVQVAFLHAHYGITIISSSKQSNKVKTIPPKKSMVKSANQLKASTASGVVIAPDRAVKTIWANKVK